MQVHGGTTFGNHALGLVTDENEVPGGYFASSKMQMLYDALRAIDFELADADAQSFFSLTFWIRVPFDFFVLSESFKIL